MVVCSGALGLTSASMCLAADRAGRQALAATASHGSTASHGMHGPRRLAVQRLLGPLSSDKGSLTRAAAADMEARIRETHGSRCGQGAVGSQRSGGVRGMDGAAGWAKAVGAGPCRRALSRCVSRSRPSRCRCLGLHAVRRWLLLRRIRCGVEGWGWAGGCGVWCWGLEASGHARQGSGRARGEGCSSRTRMERQRDLWHVDARSSRHRCKTHLHSLWAAPCWSVAYAPV